MPTSILGINNEPIFEYIDKFCTIVLILSVPIIIDIIYFTHYMEYLFFNYKTAIIITNYFVFYFISNNLFNLFSKRNLSKFLNYFCSLNIKIFSLTYQISRNLIYIDPVNNNHLFIYYVITGIQFICIFNIFFVSYLFNEFNNNIIGNYMHESSNTICPICLKTHNNWQLPCGHSFHKDCICKWFKSKTNCPLCRTEFNYHLNS